MNRVEKLIARWAKHFEAMGHPTMYTYIADHLDTGRRRRLDKVQAQYVVEVIVHCGGMRRFGLKQCYQNSQRMISNDDGGRLRYHEGYCFTSGIMVPIEHAWLTLDNKIVDVTLAVIKKDLKDTDFEYCGVQIPKEMVIKTMLETQKHCSILEDGMRAEISAYLKRRRVILLDTLGGQALSCGSQGHETKNKIRKHSRCEGIQSFAGRTADD